MSNYPAHLMAFKKGQVVFADLEKLRSLVTPWIARHQGWGFLELETEDGSAILMGLGKPGSFVFNREVGEKIQDLIWTLCDEVGLVVERDKHSLAASDWVIADLPKGESFQICLTPGEMHAAFDGFWASVKTALPQPMDEDKDRSFFTADGERVSGGPLSVEGSLRRWWDPMFTDLELEVTGLAERFVALSMVGREK